jgi:hypothetical protein
LLSFFYENGLNRDTDNGAIRNVRSFLVWTAAEQAAEFVAAGTVRNGRLFLGLTSLSGCPEVHKLSVEYNRPTIKISIDERLVGSAEDTSFRAGLVGFGVFDKARLTIHDLTVEALPTSD